MKSIRILSIGILLLFITISAAFAQTPMTLSVDATDAARNIVHSKLRIPVKPGPLTLFYPKWIPGEHSPTGPINNMVGLKLSAGGKPIAWRRDDVEMFAFHCEIPQGVTCSRCCIRRRFTTGINCEREAGTHQVESSARLHTRHK